MYFHYNIMLYYKNMHTTAYHEIALKIMEKKKKKKKMKMSDIFIKPTRKKRKPPKKKSY